MPKKMDPNQDKAKKMAMAIHKKVEMAKRRKEKEETLLQQGCSIKSKHGYIRVAGLGKRI